MGAVVAIGREGFAFGAEIGIRAHCTLVSIPDDILCVVLAQRTVTVDIVVNSGALAGAGDRLVERNEPMAWMASLSAYNAGGTEVPVRTVQALVTSTIDSLLESGIETKSQGEETYLVATVADCFVAEVAARSTK